MIEFLMACSESAGMAKNKSSPTSLQVNVENYLRKSEEIRRDCEQKSLWRQQAAQLVIANPIPTPRAKRNR